MKTTIFGILDNYGFERKNKSTMRWGCGSLVWGHIAEVKNLGNDFYEIRYHRWQYDEWGEPVIDEQISTVLHGALALQYLFERLPLFRRW